MFQRHQGSLIAVLALVCSSVALAETRVSTADALSAAVAKTAPEYPAIAKQMKVTGKVDVEVHITPAGVVDDVRALNGNALLTQSVVTALKKWKFTPFMQNGEPTTAVAVLSFEFKN